MKEIHYKRGIKIDLEPTTILGFQFEPSYAENEAMARIPSPEYGTDYEEPRHIKDKNDLSS